MSDLKIPTSAEIAAREKSEQESEQKRREDEYRNLGIELQKRQAEANSTIANLTKALVFVGFVGLVVSALQFCASKQSADAATKAAIAAEDAVRIGTGQLIQSLDAADASNQQSRAALNASINQSVIDQRAWIGLESVAVSGRDVAASIRNTGKTPAIRMSGASPIAMLRGKSDPEPDWDTWNAEVRKGKITRASVDLRIENAMRSESRKHPEQKPMFDQMIRERQALHPQVILFPNGNVMGPGTKQMVPLPGIFMGMVNSDPITVIYIIGKITYYDIFKGTPRHSTKFCLVQGEPDFKICRSGNWMD